MAVLNPESLALYPSRIGTNRANAYPHAGAYNALASGLPVFSNSALRQLRAVGQRAPERNDLRS